MTLQALGLTFSTWHGRRLFVVESYAQLFLKTLYGYRRQHRFELHAFVLMPEHVHLLFTPVGDVTLERAVQLIKGGYSHAVGGKAEIWQRGFTDHRIRDAEDFDAHRNYIHENRRKGPQISLLFGVPRLQTGWLALSG